MSILILVTLLSGDGGPEALDHRQQITPFPERAREGSFCQEARAQHEPGL